jgi:hypothetical protein
MMPPFNPDAPDLSTISRGKSRISLWLLVAGFDCIQSYNPEYPTYLSRLAWATVSGLRTLKFLSEYGATFNF